MIGKIVSTSGGIYRIYKDGVCYDVFPKGIFKYRKEHLCVGDNVEFDEDHFVIEKILERKNELIRPRCANIDLVLVTMSVVEPELSEELIYKFLTYVLMHEIEAKVVLTKVDCLEDKTQIERIKTDLAKIGIETIFVSKDDESSKQKVRELVKGKVVLFMGQTGVGKSSLINAIDPAFNRKIGEYSNALGRGKHQTKEVILLPYEDSFIADTPGFSSLDLCMYKEDLAHHFPGYEKYYTECYFSNCLHQNEKQCKIKEEIANGNLSNEAHEIYLKLLSELEYRQERYK